MRFEWIRRTIGLSLLLSLGSPSPGAASDRAAGGVLVHLFEWRWTDIARECEQFLGPNGYRRVQISPPQENALFPMNPWWDRYQPVSYRILSRGGNENEFRAMVERCRAAGVGIVVDAVLNHTATNVTQRDGVNGRGFGGTVYQKHSIPGIYGPGDYHYCHGGPSTNNLLVDFGNRSDVENCELLGLPDLKTESEHVRAELTGYLNHLLSLGVEGFRLDAAKHIPPADLRAIYGRLTRAPYTFSEVIDSGDSPVHPAEFTDLGDVTEFRYGQKLADVLLHGKLAYLSQFGESWGFSPSAHALVFVDNHDTQRSDAPSGNVLTYKNPVLYRLANVFLLGWPYGHPSVMSSYAFTNVNAGPPSTSNCGTGWVCEHRWPEIAGMVGFRNATAAVPRVTRWWSNGSEGNQIAFGRGNLGFVVLNGERSGMDATLQTDLAPGNYCNVLLPAATVSRCRSGASSEGKVMIGGDGRGRFQLAPGTSFALHLGARAP